MTSPTPALRQPRLAALGHVGGAQQDRRDLVVGDLAAPDHGAVAEEPALQLGLEPDDAVAERGRTLVRGRGQVQHVGAAALDRIGGGRGRGGCVRSQRRIGQRLLVGDLRLGGLARVLVGGIGGQRPVGGVGGLLERCEPGLGGVDCGAHSAGLGFRRRATRIAPDHSGVDRRGDPADDRSRARRERFRIDVPTTAAPAAAAAFFCCDAFMRPFLPRRPGGRACGGRPRPWPCRCWPRRSCCWRRS